jgi:signal peptidase complex subunit 1
MQVVSFVVAYSMEDLRQIFNVTAAGLAIAVLVCVPNWPFFNRNPVKFQDPVEELVAEAGETSGSTSNSTSSKRKTSKKR